METGNALYDNGIMQNFGNQGMQYPNYVQPTSLQNPYQTWNNNYQGNTVATGQNNSGGGKGLAGIGSMGLGLAQAGIGAYELYKLGKQPYPQYSVSPELQGSYSGAQQRAQTGYDPSQTLAFKQNLAQSGATAYRRGTDMAGGNLSGAINAGLQSQNINALNTFAAQGAQLQQHKQEYADNLAQAMQQQKNLMTQSQIQRRNSLEQSYGNAMSSGLKNIASSMNLTQSLGGLSGLSGLAM